MSERTTSRTGGHPDGACARQDRSIRRFRRYGAQIPQISFSCPYLRNLRLPSAKSAVLPLLLFLLAALAMGGCLKVNTRIVVNLDGSATVTERVQFSAALLDLGSEAGGDLDVAKRLTKAAVLERMKLMGPGVTLVSHEIRETETNARESVSVFKVTYLDGFQYASPFAAYADYPTNSTIRCRFRPLYKSNNYVGTAGQMGLSFHTLKRAQDHPKPDRDAPPPKGPSPQSLQILRDLRPVFADMLTGFELRLTVETYCSIPASGFGMRGQRAGANFVDVIYFADRDLDRFGTQLLDNEEIMLELLAGDIQGPNVTHTVEEFPSNSTVPVFVTFGSSNRKWYPGDEICFPPSQQLFDRHFAGKKLDFSRWAPTPEDKQPLADFAKVGWHPKKPKANGNEKAPAAP